MSLRFCALRFTGLEAWSGRGKAAAIELSDGERVELERRIRRRKSSHGAARRARMVLPAAAGPSNSAIAEKMGVSRLAVGT